MFKSLAQYQYFNQTIFLLIIASLFFYLGLGVFQIENDVKKSEERNIVLIYKLYKKIALNHDLQSFLIENENYVQANEFIDEYKKITPFIVKDEDKKVHKYDLQIKHLNAKEAAKFMQNKNLILLTNTYHIFYDEKNINLFGKIDNSRYVMMTQPVEIKAIVSKLFYYFFLLLIFFLCVFLSLLLYAFYEKNAYQRRREILENEYEKLNENALKMAFVDKLTGVATRMKLSQSLHDLIETSKRFEYPFSLIMFDIDNFKIINDTYGHDYGDYVLKEIAQEAKNQLRASDIIVRWGGEEFIVLLPMTNQDQACHIAQKIRIGIEQKKFSKSKQVTCSFGLVEYCGELGEEEIVKKADILLYQAKKSGKNCIKYEEKIC